MVWSRLAFIAAESGHGAFGTCKYKYLGWFFDLALLLSKNNLYFSYVDSILAQ